MPKLMPKPHAIITRKQLDNLKNIHFGYAELIREAGVVGIGGSMHCNAAQKLADLITVADHIISCAEAKQD